MSMANDFLSTKLNQFPKDNSKVEWLASNGEVVTGTYSGRLWFVDGMYMYYVPQFWRYIDE